MKKINLFLSLVLLVGLQSCTKDMDVVSTDPTVNSEEAMFATPQGYKQALAGVYASLSLSAFWRRVWSPLVTTLLMKF